jgi:hypothetical protein
MRWHNLTLGSEKTSTPSIEVECTFEDADENGLVEADENGLVSPPSLHSGIVHGQPHRNRRGGRALFLR